LGPPEHANARQHFLERQFEELTKIKAERGAGAYDYATPEERKLARKRALKHGGK
jgi:hypothetical protein